MESFWALFAQIFLRQFLNIPPSCQKLEKTKKNSKVNDGWTERRSDGWMDGQTDNDYIELSIGRDFKKILLSQNSTLLLSALQNVYCLRNKPY